MYFALRESDFEREEMKQLQEWLLAQTNWKLSLVKLVKEEIETNGVNDKLGIK